MKQMNREWAIEKLEHFIRTAAVHHNGSGGWSRANPLPVVQAEAQIVEQILDRVLPAWRTADWKRHSYSFWREMEASTRGVAQLKAEQELAENLGTNAPQLDASTLHPWVWGSVQGLWGSGHYRQAVGMAAVAVNAQAQAKVGRRDLSEWKLLNDAFGLKDPEPGKPRLRLAPKEDSDTWRSRHEGAGAFARGVYSAIRNPIAHEQGEELTESEALEMLAAFSLLAKWVDEAVVDRDQ